MQLLHLLDMILQRWTEILGQFQTVYCIYYSNHKGFYISFLTILKSTTLNDYNKLAYVQNIFTNDNLDIAVRQQLVAPSINGPF